MRIKTLLALFTALITAPSILVAASFDCSKALTLVEKRICSNKRLSELDSKLNSTYKYVLGYKYTRAKETLIADQKNWISNTRDKCSDDACLADAYYNRINRLTQIKTEISEARYVTDQNERSAKTAEFEKTLNNLGIAGSLTACDLMVEVFDSLGGRDQSYGAVCKLNERMVMICDDTMIGKLTLKLGDPSRTGEGVADFTQTNCPRGG